MSALAQRTLFSRSSDEACVLFPSLPDPVGFAGHFAANLKGRLVMGGGSQFPNQPFWRGGQKVYNDRIFALSSPNGDWMELETHLPRGAGHFAFAATENSILLAGGIAEEGLLDEVWELMPDARGEIVFKKRPPLPRPLMYAAGAIAQDRFFVMGGQLQAGEKVASTECWSLDLGASSDHVWRREPDLPQPGAFVAAAASDGRNVYLIGGVGFDGEKRAIQSGQLLKLEAGAREWIPLNSLPEPRVGAVTPCPILDGKKIFVMGGYARSFPGEPREHPGFSRQTWIYDIALQTWREGPVLPHEPPVDRDLSSDKGPCPMIAAPGAIWNDHFVAVSGEVRASVRTPAMIGYPLHSL